MESCPKCSVDIPPEYKYCPHCGFQLLLSLDGILLSKLFGEVEPRMGVHSLAQRRLWTIGRELGFYSIMEYGVPDLTKDGRRSYIDVVWKSRNGIEFAFEIRRKIHDLDLVTTIKDTNKLQNLIARKKFVVNVSEITGRAYFCEISDEPKALVSEPTPMMTFESAQKNMGRKKTYSVAVIRQKHPRAYEKWTGAEDAQLTNDYREGLSTLQLAERYKRKCGAISSRLRKLGLKQ